VTTDALTLAVNQFRWGDSPALATIRTDEDFSLDDLVQDLGRLARKSPINLLSPLWRTMSPMRWRSPSSPT
jgi:hypothetical protein